MIFFFIDSSYSFESFISFEQTVFFNVMIVIKYHDHIDLMILE